MSPPPPPPPTVKQPQACSIIRSFTIMAAPMQRCLELGHGGKHSPLTEVLAGGRDEHAP